MLVAKPVIDKQFWILQENNRKVGNVEACAGGYQVKINNQIAQFKTIRMAAQRANIEFEPAVKTAKPKVTVNQVHGYPVSGRVHNPMWDVTQQLPVYTKTAKSKSWFAAGWYNVRKGRHWQTVLAPKLIVLQRYAHAGPFLTQEQADDHAHTEVR
jgi:1,4-dihydroxy-2-naphthoyl-CoA synthase